MIRGFYRDRIMSRHRYRQMAQARGMLNHRQQATLTPDELAAIDRETNEGIAAARARDAKALERIHHPAIPAPEFKCYRVIRQYRQHGTVEIEDIGYSKDLGTAMAICGREVGWACLVGPDGKRSSYNWQPMETRA